MDNQHMFVSLERRGNMNTLGGGELWSGKNNLVGPVSPFKC